ncbi:MAG TPA: hypothetical protein VID96_06000, partial [Xanthobacteraceae bacterium]
SSEVGTGSREENASNKKLSPVPIQIRTEQAQSRFGVVHPPYRFMAIKWRTATRGAQLVESQC